jgi:transposase
MPGTILAIELGKFHSVACFYEVADGRHDFKRIETSPRGMHELLAERKAVKVAIEMSGQAGWVVDLCRGLEIEVEVANANGEA